jgi:hypothetical protein
LPEVLDLKHGARPQDDEEVLAIAPRRAALQRIIAGLRETR